MIGLPSTWSWTTQNLDELPGDEHGRPSGSIFLHGRARLHLGRPYMSPSLRFEWTLRDSFCHASIRVDETDRDVALSIAIPRLAVWVTFAGVPRELFAALGLPGTDADGHRVWEREIKVSIHDAKLWWALWVDTMSWSSKTPRWRHGSFDPLEVLFGREIPSRVDLRTERVEVPMPEGVYPATIEWSRRTLRRARWPFRFGPERLVQSWLSYTLTPDAPIGFPGKGESAHDCGDDAMHSLSGSARNAEEAIAAVVASVLRDRRRNGGSHRFVPSKPEGGAESAAAGGAA